MATSDVERNQAHMPSDVSPHVGLFDRFARLAARFTARAAFFVVCVGLVLVWLTSYPLFSNFDTWQLVINTLTTIVTFLLVALFQNSTTRADTAVQDKLNAIAEALADVMGHLGPELEEDIRELRAAVGIEERESA